MSNISVKNPFSLSKFFICDRIRGKGGRMNIKDVIGGFFNVAEVKPGEVFKVITPLILFGKTRFVFYVEKCEEGFKITDRKLACFYFSQLFDMSSPDVKSCVREVLAINKVYMKKAEIFVYAKDETDFNKNLANFMVAISQIVRMEAFFDH